MCFARDNVQGSRMVRCMRVRVCMFFFFRSRFCSRIFFVFFLLLAFFARGTVASGSEGRVEFDHICVKINERH